LTARRSIQALILLGLFACGVSGCFGYGYPDYPVYGYAPYSWGWTHYGRYEPVFVVHHPWEEHHGFGGHHETFYHSPSGQPGSFGHAAGGPHGGGHH
jgi:hypothetical protein